MDFIQRGKKNTKQQLRFSLKEDNLIPGLQESLGIVHRKREKNTRLNTGNRKSWGENDRDKEK